MTADAKDGPKKVLQQDLSERSTPNRRGDDESATRHPPPNFFVWRQVPGRLGSREGWRTKIQRTMSDDPGVSSR